ncbi:OLC1v1033034C1 [Oldenlandia corymbosa var. corymbosa]|uniref:OLC1v1033034C1 n=1 Tax=Oldenlandia corymbosa var. corymbosa TaxID=529605 RepID=A0AAV1CNU1_OLDCO|nr:OLC1v1033034C1 [Oldenlandia corymbosa var. corymbosa]
MSFLLIFFLLQLFSNLHLSKSQLQNPQIISNFSVSDSPWTPDKNQILLSPNSTFAAGFLPLPSNLYTFSVWYYAISKKFNLETVVWSANDNSPVNNSASLIITSSGELSLSNPGGRNLWPAKTPPVRSGRDLVLLESGNLTFGDWGSFAHPTNTILPNQIIKGTTLSTRNGKYQFLDTNKLVYKDAADTYWGPVNAFLNLDDQGTISQEGSTIISSDFGDLKTRRLTLDEDGNLRHYSFDTDLGNWTVVWKAVGNLCRIKATCGAYAICSYEPSKTSTSCKCLPGFREMKSSSDDFVCQRKTPIRNSANTSKFMSLDYVSFTASYSGTQHFDFPVSTLSECQVRCLGNQTCEGFQFKYDGSNTCVMLNGTLEDGLWSPESESTDWYFPCWAFDQVFKETNIDDILDPRIKHSYDSRAHFDMVNRMLMTAMWCIQDRAENRPTMGKVAKMLEGTVEIGLPKKPTLYYAEQDEE